MSRINKIKKLCNNILGEEFYKYIRERDGSEITPVLIDPSKSELMKMWKDSHYSIRFIIYKEHYIVFEGTYLTHGEVIDEIELEGDFISGYIDGNDKEIELYRDEFRRYLGKNKLNDNDMIKYFESTDIFNKLSLKDKNYNYLISNLGNMQESLSEDYFISTRDRYSSRTLDLYKNSNAIEIRKLIKDSYYKRLRFLMNEKEDYLVWDASEGVHVTISNNKEARDFLGQGVLLKGEFGDDIVILSGESANEFFEDDIFDSFFSSKLGMVLDKIGVKELHLNQFESLQEASLKDAQSVADSMVLEPRLEQEDYALINVNISILDKLAGGSASYIRRDLYGASPVYDKDLNLEGTKISRFKEFIKSHKGEFHAPYITYISFYQDSNRITSLQLEGNHRYATLRKYGAKTMNIGVPRIYLDRLKKIPNLINNVISEADGIGSAIGQTLGTIAGTAVTALARVSGIPFLPAIGDWLGKQANQGTVSLFNKLMGNHKDIQQKVQNNYYFYKDDYIKYQSGSYGYDTEIPQDRLNPNELNKIKQYLYPSFKKFGYSVKILGKRTEDKNYICILFKNGSTVPLKDSRQNATVYPIPFDVFQRITDSDSSDIAIVELLNLYKLQISNI